jgi:hypothetical protein
MFEADQPGDSTHRVIRLGEQLLGTAELNGADLGLGRTLQVFLELPIEGRSRQQDMAAHVADG